MLHRLEVSLQGLLDQVATSFCFLRSRETATSSRFGDDEQQVTRVVHDESTYYVNCDVPVMFLGDEETNVLKQKYLGASIMISDFVD